ncbi:MAG: hypothetical protein HY054_16000 [Proteobacteria bacterium]|nr:hypothetical protein [Pseudomonadota bacterium]
MIAMLDIAGLAVALLLLSIAAASALTAQNLGRRVIGLFVVLVGAILAAAALRADGGMIIMGAVVATSYAAIGVALLVRSQETYQSVEADDLDAADLRDEPVEPRV